MLLAASVDIIETLQTTFPEIKALKPEQVQGMATVYFKTRCVCVSDWLREITYLSSDSCAVLFVI